MTMFGVADNMTNLLENSMEQWNTELISGGESLGTCQDQTGDISRGQSIAAPIYTGTNTTKNCT